MYEWIKYLFLIKEMDTKVLCVCFNIYFECQLVYTLHTDDTECIKASTMCKVRVTMDT